MTDLELLRGIRELIGVPERWTRGSYGRDASGIDVRVSSPKATCFCLAGAGAKLAGLDTATCALENRLATLLELGDEVTRFNDTHTHAEVIALLDSRIAELDTSS